MGELGRAIRRGRALPVLARLRRAAAPRSARGRRPARRHHGARLRARGEPHTAAGGARRRTGRTGSPGTHVRRRAARRVARGRRTQDRAGRGGAVGPVADHREQTLAQHVAAMEWGCAARAGSRSSSRWDPAGPGRPCRDCRVRRGSRRRSRRWSRSRSGDPVGSAGTGSWWRLAPPDATCSGGHGTRWIPPPRTAPADDTFRTRGGRGGRCGGAGRSAPQDEYRPSAQRESQRESSGGGRGT